MTIRSAVTNYYSPIMNNNDSPFEDHSYVSTSGSHFLPDFSFDLKTLSPAKIYEKYFFTIIIILICIGVIACCFTPGVFLCIRYCGTNALLGLVTKYSPSDFKKLDNYRVKKERNSEAYHCQSKNNTFNQSHSVVRCGFFQKFVVNFDSLYMGIKKFCKKHLNFYIFTECNLRTYFHVVKE